MRKGIGGLLLLTLPLLSPAPAQSWLTSNVCGGTWTYQGSCLFYNAGGALRVYATSGAPFGYSSVYAQIVDAVTGTVYLECALGGAGLTASCTNVGPAPSSYDATEFLCEVFGNERGVFACGSDL